MAWPRTTGGIFLGPHKGDTVMYWAASQQCASHGDKGGLYAAVSCTAAAEGPAQVRASGPPPHTGRLLWRVGDSVPCGFPASLSVSQ